ncbi:MAG: hypothetical protein QOJ19_5015 [Acidimicrobiia bacterium]|nr:hypothetical protein [Acidimicrobiia bacterium]
MPHFAYPYDSLDQAARDAVEAAGYLAGCSRTRKPGRNRSGEDVFLLRRIGIGGHDELPAFRWKGRSAWKTSSRGCWRGLARQVGC